MRGIVVAPQALATETGVLILRNGGNAFDAAVAAAFVQTVIDPQMCGLGGFGIANVRTRDGDERVVDFNATAGSRVTEKMWMGLASRLDWTGYGYHIANRVNELGYQSIMTPGTVAGLAELLTRFGSLSWAEVLAPAIALSEAGLLVTTRLWQAWNTPQWPVQENELDRLRSTDASRLIYFKPDGSPYSVGERIPNPDYSLTLRRLADGGPREFYEGSLAQELATDLERGGAFVTRDDLAQYRVTVADPLVGSYRGRRVSTAPPAGGGLCLLQILKILEHDNLQSLGLNTVNYIKAVALAMKAGFHDWHAFAGDPSFVNVPISRLLSRSHAEEWHLRIERQESFSVPSYHEPSATTTVTVVDETGNAIALTHTLGSASGVVSPGFGFLWNNGMNCFDPTPGRPNSIAPRKSRLTGICPTLIYHDEQIELVLGAPGGTRIITGTLQTILNIIDHSLTPVEAVSAPRFDCQGGVLDCEARIPSGIRNGLREVGFEIHPNFDTYSDFGFVHIVYREHDSGRLCGAADPRAGGAAFCTSQIEDHPPSAASSP